MIIYVFRRLKPTTFFYMNNYEHIQGLVLIDLIIIIALSFLIIKVMNIVYKNHLAQKQNDLEKQLTYEGSIESAIIHAQENERKAIAAELHDQISSKLNLILLLMRNITTTEQHTEFESIKTEIKKLILKNRDISHYLFPIEIEDLGLLLTLEDLSIKYQEDNFTIQLHYTKSIDFPNKHTELQLYRIIQEFISNSIKHGKACQIIIQFKIIKNYIAILLNDNGIGCDFNTVKKGLGWHNIHTRLEAMKANFKYKSSALGTRLIILI